MAPGKSKPKVPMYQKMKDTPWITRNRELNKETYGNISRDLNNVNVFDDATKQQLEAVTGDMYNRSLSDFDRDYNQTMAKTLARDYNRFGTTGSANSLLTRDNYNLAQQRKLADLAYNKALNYESMINNELNRRYKWLDTNYNYFTNSGNTTEQHDITNWKIGNQNLDRQYINDLQKYNQRNMLGKTLGTIGSVALGFTPLGPLGYILGQTLTSGLFDDAENLLGGPNGATNLNTDNLFNSLGYFGAKNNLSGWSSGKLKGDEVKNTGYNPFSASLGTIGTGNYNDNSLWLNMVARGLI